MLKPAEQPPQEPDRSIGEAIEQVFDNALDYARAELELLKARALEIVQDYVRAAILFADAGVFALAGLVTLFVGIALGLARWLGPLGGALVSTLLAAGIAGLLAWLALGDIKEAE
ncbi:MAG TPA: phage holin family protein [Sphingomicrobium sp.]|nr:phage holin family protein [Sphingomicrobium sp.]